MLRLKGAGWTLYLTVIAVFALTPLFVQAWTPSKAHPRGELIGQDQTAALQQKPAKLPPSPGAPKPQTANAKSEGRFGKQDFAYLPTEDAYRCPAGERLPYCYTNEEEGKVLLRYWTTACQACSLKIPMHAGSRAADYTVGARASA